MQAQEPFLQHDLAAYLTMLDAFGVDCLVGEQPRSLAQVRAAAENPQRLPRPTASTTPPPPAPALVREPAVNPTGGHSAVADARRMATEAASLEDLRTLMQNFDGCSLKRTATQLVFGDGAPHARVMLIGEAPGRDEDLDGRPFVGRSGQLLNRMLHAAGFERGSAYITNVVPWRPPGNRTPTPEELAICKPFIERHIELIAPDVLVLLGGPAAQNLLPVRDGVLKLRGRFFDYTLSSGKNIPALVTLHPAYLLRQPAQKRLAWQDFKALRRRVSNLSS